MIIKLTRGGKVNCLTSTGGGETKGLATPGGVVSPSIRQTRLKCLLTVFSSKNDCYGEKAALH